MRTTALKSLVCTLVSFVVVLVLSLANPVPASAHAVLLETTPGNWQVLDDQPKRITLRFNEPIDVALAEVQLIGPRGDTVPGVGPPAHPAGKADTLSVAVPPGLVNGTHTVTYRVTSADAHPATGAFTFSVRQIGGAVTATTASDEGGGSAVAVAYGLVRWLGFAGLALLIGTAFFTVTCWPGGATARGTRRLLLGGWIALVLSTVLNLLLYGPYAAGRCPGTVFDPALLASTLGSRLGLILGLRLVALGIVAVAMAFLLRRGTPVPDREPREKVLAGSVVLAAGTVLAISWGLTSHSASGGLSALTVPADAVHLVAMSVWLGGLATLLGVLLRSGDVLAMRQAIPRFSRMALICVGILVGTGTHQAWRQVGTPSALFGTAYGTLLLAKLGLVIVLIGLGVLARRWVQRHYHVTIESITDKRRARRAPGDHEVGRFRRMVAAEVTVAAVVLGVTATMLSVEPARAELDREVAVARAPARGGPMTVAVPFHDGDEQLGGQLAVSITPGKVGSNEMHLVVLDRRGMPREVPEVKAELSLKSRSVGSLPVELRSLGAGHYVAAGAALPIPGTWELAVTVRTTDVDQDTVRIPVGAS